MGTGIIITIMGQTGIIITIMETMETGIIIQTEITTMETIIH